MYPIPFVVVPLVMLLLSVVVIVMFSIPFVVVLPLVMLILSVIVIMLSILSSVISLIEFFISIMVVVIFPISFKTRFFFIVRDETLLTTPIVRVVVSHILLEVTLKVEFVGVPPVSIGDRFHVLRIASWLVSRTVYRVPVRARIATGRRHQAGSNPSAKSSFCHSIPGSLEELPRQFHHRRVISLTVSPLLKASARRVSEATKVTDSR